MNNITDRATKFLTQIGLTIPPSGKGENWITLCAVKVHIHQYGSKRKSYERTCKKTVRGEIKETRVIVNVKKNCIYNIERYTSGETLSQQEIIVNQYKYGVE